MLLVMKTRMLSCQMGNGQGKGNENVKKRFKKQNNNFVRAARFLIHVFAVRARPPREISPYDVLWGCAACATFFFSFFFLNSGEVPRNSTLGKFTYFWHFKRIGINLHAIKKPNLFQQPCYHNKTHMNTLRNQLRVMQLLIFGAKRRRKPFVSRFTRGR